MLVEKIIFTILATYLLIAGFFRLAKRKDKVYIVMLVLELLGLILELIEIIFSLRFNIFVKIIMYLISIVIPIIILVLEHNGRNFAELLYTVIAKFYEITRK